jgi:hypothetical protein
LSKNDKRPPGKYLGGHRFWMSYSMDIFTNLIIQAFLGISSIPKKLGLFLLDGWDKNHSIQCGSHLKATTRFRIDPCHPWAE